MAGLGKDRLLCVSGEWIMSFIFDARASNGRMPAPSFIVNSAVKVCRCIAAHGCIYSSWLLSIKTKKKSELPARPGHPDRLIEQRHVRWP